jgi:uncharacterized protein YcgI (DUF1989 family)
MDSKTLQDMGIVDDRSKAGDYVELRAESRVLAVSEQRQ